MTLKRIEKTCRDRTCELLDGIARGKTPVMAAGMRVDAGIAAADDGGDCFQQQLDVIAARELELAELEAEQQLIDALAAQHMRSQAARENTEHFEQLLAECQAGGNDPPMDDPPLEAP